MTPRLRDSHHPRQAQSKHQVMGSPCGHGATFSVLTSHSDPTVPSPVSVMGGGEHSLLSAQDPDASLYSCRMILLTLFSGHTHLSGTLTSL